MLSSISSSCDFHFLLHSDYSDVSQSAYYTARKRKASQSQVVASPNHREEEEHSGPPKLVLFGLKVIIGIIFFVVFLVSSVLSKVTFFSLTNELRSLTMNESINGSRHDSESMLPEDKSKAVTIYWQLLIILLVPNIITFLRCLFFGFLGKTTTNFPWPRKEAALVVSQFTVVECMQGEGRS